MRLGSFAVPKQVLEDMYCNSSKTARLSALFVPKHPGTYTCLKVPYLCLATKRWIISTASMQVLVWGASTTVVGVAAHSSHIPWYLLGVISPVLLAVHLYGFASFIYRRTDWGASYCAMLVLVALACLVEVFASIRRSQLLPLVVALGTLVLMGMLFFFSASLILTLRVESREHSILLPVEVLDERPSEAPFLRWYFTLPLWSPPPRLASANATWMRNSAEARSNRDADDTRPSDRSPNQDSSDDQSDTTSQANLSTSTGSRSSRATSPHNPTFLGRRTSSSQHHRRRQLFALDCARARSSRRRSSSPGAI